MKNLQCTSMNEDVLKENNGYKYEFILCSPLHKCQLFGYVVWPHWYKNKASCK